MTTLASEIFNSKLQRAKALLEEGVDINAMHNGTYPIISAINSDDPNTLRFVIENNADVNIESGLALFEAIDICVDGMIQNNRNEFYPESLEMVKILLENGAELEIQNSNGQKPLDILNIYAKTPESFESLKSLFRPAIGNIDELIEFIR